MRKKLSLILLTLLVAALLAACGDNTPTPAASSTTAAAGAATTAASGAATTAAATTAAAPAVANTPLPTLPAQAPAATSSDTGVGPVGAWPTPPADAKKGGTLTIANAGPLSPTLPATGSSTDVTAAYLNLTNLIWANGLLEFNYTTLKWQLDMAKDFKVDPTGKIFTFTLRPDLKWSDGSPITADDFQFTFENISKENKENPAFNYALLSDMKRISSYKGDAAAGTVTVTMNDVYARDIALYYVNFSPVPKKIWEGKPYFDPSNNPEIKKPSVVNGPYKIESYDPNTQGVFVANQYFHRGKPNFDKIILKPFAPNLVYEALKTGQADVSISLMPPSQFNEVKANADLKTYEWYGVQSEYRYIVYNTTKAPGNDKALRQAIGYALDRNAMIKLAENGRAVPQFTFTNENSPYFNPEINRYNYDIEKSKKILADAGYTLQGATLVGKDGQPVKFTLSHANEDVPGKLAATYVQAQLKQLGIDVTVEGKDGNTYLTALVTKKYDVGVGTTGGSVFPDPDTVKFFYTKDGVFNVAGYAVPRLDEIFAQASHELDNAKRKQLYGEAQKILTEDLPSQVFYAQIAYIAANKKVGGIVPSKGGRIGLNYAVSGWYFTS
jgi:peptide/nickel transport system substrate-binding protein